MVYVHGGIGFLLRPIAEVHAYQSHEGKKCWADTCSEKLYNCGYQGNNWQAVANRRRDVLL